MQETRVMLAFTDDPAQVELATYRKNGGYEALEKALKQMSPEEIENGCLEARRAFYRWGSILHRGLRGANRRGGRVRALYYWINYLLRRACKKKGVLRPFRHPSSS